LKPLPEGTPTVEQRSALAAMVRSLSPASSSQIIPKLNLPQVAVAKKMNRKNSVTFLACQEELEEPPQTFKKARNSTIPNKSKALVESGLRASFQTKGYSVRFPA